MQRQNPQKRGMLSVVMGLAVLGVVGAAAWGAVSSEQAIRDIADRLAAAQVIEGAQTGYWPGESQYTGSIVAGLAAAYRRQCVPAWRDAAVRGGAFITYATGGYFLRGEDAFAMVMLSEISADPKDNPYRRSLEAFYRKVRTRPGGTMRFITDFKMRYEPSTAVLHMAYHTVAAHYVNAAEKQLFRGVLLMYLALVNDEAASWPVMALGLATWALAETGPLDKTPVVWWDGDWPVWGRRRLNELSTLLCSHQLDDPGGSFYWRFDHTDGMWGLAKSRGRLYGRRGLCTAGSGGLAAPGRRYRIGAGRCPREGGACADRRYHRRGAGPRDRGQPRTACVCRRGVDGVVCRVRRRGTGYRAVDGAGGPADFG